MENFTNQDKELLYSLCAASMSNLFDTMKQFLKKRYEEVYSSPKYIIAKGNLPIALAAHLDTVFKICPTEFYYDQEQSVIWSPTGLGADDRAGVFAIIKLISSGFKPTVILTTDEETGAFGAEVLSTTFADWGKDLKYIIQLDRRGENDCVFYDCDNKDFIKYVESFGFKEAIGSFTDISVICPKWKVAGVNLSVGYEREHSQSETLNVRNLKKTITRVKKMLSKANEAPFFEYIENPSAFNWFGKYNSFVTTVNCHLCGKEGYNVTMVDIGDTYCCTDCIADTKAIDWCQYCGEPYYITEDTNNDNLCADCYQTIIGGINVHGAV